jgi:hypothetical protein
MKSPVTAQSLIFLEKFMLSNYVVFANFILHFWRQPIHACGGRDGNGSNQGEGLTVIKIL